jgi:hypothetical protein
MVQVCGRRFAIQREDSPLVPTCTNTMGSLSRLLIFAAQGIETMDFSICLPFDSVA